MSKRLKILLVFISLSITLCLMSNTYSRYIANTSGDLEVLFAKWQILVNNKDIMDSTNSTISLVPTMEDDETYIKKDTIAPSSKGYFDIIIDSTNVDVSYNYTINLVYDNQDIPDLVITKYIILDQNSNELEDNITYNTLENNRITGNINVNSEVQKTTKIRIYFQWIEGTGEQMNNEADTNASRNNSTFNVTANISFQQEINNTTNETQSTEVVETSENL